MLIGSAADTTCRQGPALRRPSGCGPARPPGPARPVATTSPPPAGRERGCRWRAAARRGRRTPSRPTAGWDTGTGPRWVSRRGPCRRPRGPALCSPAEAGGPRRPPAPRGRVSAGSRRPRTTGPGRARRSARRSGPARGVRPGPRCPGRARRRQAGGDLTTGLGVQDVDPRLGSSRQAKAPAWPRASTRPGAGWAITGMPGRTPPPTPAPRLVQARHEHHPRLAVDVLAHPGPGHRIDHPAVRRPRRRHHLLPAGAAHPAKPPLRAPGGDLSGGRLVATRTTALATPGLTHPPRDAGDTSVCRPRRLRPENRLMLPARSSGEPSAPPPPHPTGTTSRSVTTGCEPDPDYRCITRCPRQYPGGRDLGLLDAG